MYYHNSSPSRPLTAPSLKHYSVHWSAGNGCHAGALNDQIIKVASICKIFTSSQCDRTYRTNLLHCGVKCAVLEATSPAEVVGRERVVHASITGYYISMSNTHASGHDLDTGAHPSAASTSHISCFSFLPPESKYLTSTHSRWT